jgi:hypothetical protein
MTVLAAIFKFTAYARSTGLKAALLVWVGGMLALAAEAQAQEGRELEYEVKAAFLLKFAMFVQWPTNALSSDVQAPLLIGILGDDPFGEKFDQSLKNEKVNGRAVQIRRANEVAGLVGCHVVFISASERARFSDLLAAFRDRQVLTVADEPGFASQGGMIGLYKEAGKVRFEINPPAIERAGLKASSKLLQVGRRITEPAGPPS